MASVISIDLGSSSVKLVLSGARSGRGGESLEQRSRPVAVSGATASPLGARLAALDALLQELGPQEGAVWATSDPAGRRRGVWRGHVAYTQHDFQRRG